MSRYASSSIRAAASDLRGGVSRTMELGGELLEDDRGPRPVVQDRAVEVEDDDGDGLTGDRPGSLTHPRKRAMLLGGRVRLYAELMLAGAGSTPAEIGKPRPGLGRAGAL